jgi:hypothetical protein
MAFGAIDLFSGQVPATGTNLFKVDKNPLQQIDQGVEDVIGKLGKNTAQVIWDALQAIVDKIIGSLFPGVDITTLNADWSKLTSMFSNLWTFLGELNPLDPNFDPVGAIVTFIEDMLKPSNLLATLVSDATHSGGVTGFIPLENLALDLIAGGTEAVQSLIDAIMNAFGFGAGTASYDEVQKLFGFFYAFLGNPSGWLSDLTDAGASIINFIEHQLMPTNLLTGFDMFMLHWRTGLNLVLDPSFETTLVWPGAIMGTQSTDHARTGTHSMKITADGTTRDGHLLRNQVGPLTQYVKSGQTFDVEAFVWPDTATTTAGTGHLDLVMIATESSGSDPSSEVSATRITMPTPGQWTWMRGKVTVPSTYNYDSADFVLRFESDIPTGDIVYIDDIAVIDTSAQQDILQAILNSVGLGGILNVTQLDTFFHNLTEMLGLPTLADVSFDIENAINNFVNNMLDPSVYFSNLTAMLGLPTLSDVAFDVTTAINTFITNMLHPANLLAPMDPITKLIDQLHIPALTSSWLGTLHGSRLLGAITDQNIIPALTSTWVNSIHSSKLFGLITDQNIIPSLTSAWLGTIHGWRLTGAITDQNIIPALTSTWVNSLHASKLFGAITDQNVIPALTSTWLGTLSGSKLLGLITDQNVIPALTSAWLGTIHGWRLTGAITDQNIIPALTSTWINSFHASKLVGAITDQNVIPALTSTWVNSLHASKLFGAITDQNVIPALTSTWLGTLSGSKLLGLITDQNIIPALTSAWTGTIHGWRLTGAITDQNIIPALTSTWINSFHASKLVGAITDQNVIPALTSTWLGTLSGSKLLGLITDQNIIPALTSAWTGTIHGWRLTGAITDQNIIPALTSTWINTFHASKLVGAITDQNVIPALTSTWVNSLHASKLFGAITDQNVIPALTSTWVGTLSGAKLLGAITDQNIIPALTSTWVNSFHASKLVGAITDQTVIPALTSAWGKTIAGNLLGSAITNQNWIPALTSTWGGTIHGSLLTGAINVAVGIAGSQLTSAITNQNFIPALTSAWVNTVDGGLLRNAITTATLAGSQLSSAITNQNWIPTLTSAWTNTIHSTRLTGAITDQNIIPALTSTWLGGLSGSRLTDAITNANWIPGLDATKIITGTFANAMSPGLLPQTLWQAARASGTNLVLSPDFEDTTVTRFTGSYGTPVDAAFGYTTAQAHSGTHSYSVQTSTDVSTQYDVVFFAPTTPVTTQLYDAMTRCQPGQWFNIELYIRAKSTNTTTTGGAYLGVFVVNYASGGSVQTSIWAQSVNFTAISTTGWMKMSGWVQIPPGYDIACGIVGFSGQNAGAQTYYLDDVRCVEETHAQSLTDLFSQGLYGASRPAIPVVFDAVGAGVQLSSTVVTENHTITGPNAVVFVSTYDTPGTLTVRIGGSSGPLMTQVASVSYSSAPVLYLFAFVLQNAPTGVQQIYASASNSVAMSINSESFSSAVSFGTPVTAFSSTNTTPSLTVSGTNSYDRVVAAFGGYATNLTGFNQTQRSNQPFTAGAGLPLVIGDAPGAASVNFSCTTSSLWGGIAIPINGTPASSTNTGNPVSSLFAGLQDMMTRIYSQPTLGSFIPGLNVQSPIGGVLTDVTTAFQSTVDKTIQGVTGGTGSGNAVGQLASVFNQAMGYLGFNFGNQTTPPTNSVAGTTGTNQTSLNNRAVTKPSYNAIDPTADSVFPLSSISGSSSATTVSVTAAQSAMGIIGTPDAGVKQSVEWLGYGPATITGVYYNIYSMNGSTGALTLVYASPNVVGNITLGGSSPTWVNLAIPAANYLTAQQNTYYAMEVVIAGTGTYSLAGINHAWLPSAGHPTAYPKQLAVTRAISAGTIAIDAAPAGTNVAVAGAATQNTNVTIAATATALVVGVTVVTAANTTSAPTISCKIGSTTLAQLGVYQYGPVGGVCSTVALYGLINPPTGAQTITTTATPNPLASDAAYLSVGVDTYTNVASFGTAQTANGSTAAPSHTVTSGATGGRIVQMFGVVQANVSLTLSAYNQTQRQNVASGASSYGSCVMGDAAGAASVTISATLSSAASWGSVAVPLNPAPAAPPSSIPSPTWSQTVPWMALSGAAAATTYAPLVTQYAAAGSYTYSVPSWMKAGNHFDILVVGAGMGGQGGGGPSNGVGGGAGIWATPVTLVYGVDIPTSTTSFTVTIGAGGIGGAGGGGFPSGSAGAQSQVAMTGHTTITANGGSSAAGSTTGLSPGNQPLTGADGYAGIYYGGGAQPAASANGNAPGGGGGGGIWGYFNALAAGPGGKGGDGGVWIRAYM